jgi:HEAT repeat protein
MATTILNNVLKKLKSPDFILTEKELDVFSDMDPKGVSTLLQEWKGVNDENKTKFLQELHEHYLDNTLVSFEALGVALIKDDLASVRASALQLIDETEKCAILPDLVKMITTDADENVREAAVRVVGNFVRLYEYGDLDDLDNKTAENVLLKAYHDEHSKVARAALESLGYAGRDEVYGLIEQSFEKKDTAWQVSALRAAGRSADDRWAGQILNGLNDADSDVCLAAIESAGELELKLARQPLLDMLEEIEDVEMYEAIIWSLSSIGGEDVRTYLEALIANSEDEDLIELIEDALMNLTFTEDLESFDMMAIDPDEEDDLK